MEKPNPPSSRSSSTAWRRMSSVSEDTALAVQTWRLKMLLEWREHLPTLAEAAKEAFGEAEVYIFGSAVEGKLTADSDVDVLAVSDKAAGPQRHQLAAAIEEKLKPPSSSKYTWRQGRSSTGTRGTRKC
ncbi:MAG: nucleotidyltransferase domain-containing protein [Ignisphaera sp.]